MNIRPFRESDFPEIIHIYARCKLDELAYENNTFKLIPLDRDQKRLTELQESAIYVCEADGVVGYGALFGSQIRALFIHPDSRGKGFGKRLLTHLLSLSDGPVTLQVVKSNLPAMRLYQECSFKLVEEIEAFYNGVDVIAYKMLRP